MGYYINYDSKGKSLPAQGKAEEIVKDGGKILSRSMPPKFVPNLVCIIHNINFDAAGFCFDEREYHEFANLADPRPKTWIVYEHAARLSGYDRH